MPLSVFLLLASLAATPPAVIGGDGRLLPEPAAGWRVTLDPVGRAHFARVEAAPALAKPLASTVRGTLWDDELRLPGVWCAVRTTAVRDGEVYVAGRLQAGDHTESFLLRWNARSGRWSEVSALPREVADRPERS